MNLSARHLMTCTYCGVSAVLRNTTGDELTMWVNGHAHPHCGPVTITVRLIRRLAA
jgi:hypothetical protein